MVTPATRSATIPWWEPAVVYQIYPRSFQDSDGDGIGDLRGIEQRLDYLAELGVDALWLSPIFPSPMADFGYDVADYCGVDPLFGTLDDFDRLLGAAHDRGLKLMLDLVPNHTSDQHPWFKDSRSSRSSPRREWYIWRDPGPDGAPPNNWIADFGGSAWEWDDASGQYYLHAFLKEQPDLNWRNPEVKAAMLDVMRFWFDRGVDGFRIDVLWHLIKAQGLPDNSVNPEYRPEMGEKLRVLQLNSTNQPEVHELAAEFRALADEYGDRLLVGEVVLPLAELMKYYGQERPGVHLPFNFQLVEAPWSAAVLRTMIANYEAALPPGAWPNWVIASHDYPRIAAKLGEAQARIAAMLLLTLRGTPTLYQGDELGIGQVEIPQGRVSDPKELREPGIGLGRDPSRTPMAWDGSPRAGFSNAEPWLPLHNDWRTRNVAAEELDLNSMLSLYRALLRLRRSEAALSMGSIELIDAEPDVIAYERKHGSARILVTMNLSAEPRGVELPQGTAAETLLSTLAVRPFDAVLQPNEGLILKLEVQ
jgi:oligo-1,6-glucosidase/alpha-glucosidase